MEEQAGGAEFSPTLDIKAKDWPDLPQGIGGSQTTLRRVKHAQQAPEDTGKVPSSTQYLSQLKSSKKQSWRQGLGTST